MHTHKGKRCFKTRVKKQDVMIRAVCLLLKYTVDGEQYILTVTDHNGDIEIPGGKVEQDDADIYDTGFREAWEEIILKDVFDKENVYHMPDWRNARLKLLNSTEKDEVLISDVYEKMKSAPSVLYGKCPLKTMYFVINIDEDQANHLIKEHKLIPVSVGIIQSVYNFNRRQKKPNKRYHRKTTYFNTESGVYKMRGRDFDGIFRFTPLLGE